MSVAVIAASSAAAAAADPGSDTTIVLDGSAGLNKRQQAFERLWNAVAAGEHDRLAARETAKQLIWKGSAPSQLRVEALRRLLDEPDPALRADTRKLIRLRLPTESQWPVIDAISAAVKAGAADASELEGWREVAPALVRSYSRRVPSPPDADRPERDALMALFPGQSLEAIVFDIYLKPDAGKELAGQSPDLVEKQRQAAWELLGRIDPDGSVRGRLLAAAGDSDPAVAPLTRAARELRVVPVTGSELAWLKSLIESKDPGAAQWWADTAAAAKSLTDEQAQSLQMRHLEPLRWAAKNRTEWLAADRASLIRELATRLDGRRHWRKTADLGDGVMISKEMLTDWQDDLCWGDALAILTIDEALKDPRVRAALFEQAAADRADTSAEYGGGLWATDAVPGAPGSPKWGVKDQPAGFIAHGYAPRPSQRINDRTFVAPEDMFTAEGAGGRSLAHYHFHVQIARNTDYAGPGHGDMEYAATHGRACLVFTSVSDSKLNVDYYQRPARPGAPGAQIDLGEVSSGR